MRSIQIEIELAPANRRNCTKKNRKKKLRMNEFDEKLFTFTKEEE